MRGLAGVAFVTAVLLSTASFAQAPPPPPPPSPQADAIRQCLCLQQSMERASSEMTAKRNSLDQINDQLRQADATLERERAGLNVNDPQAVAQFRQRLEQRDALFKRSTGAIVSDVSAAVQRFNDRVGAYNQQCANRPFDSILHSQVQATLSCPVE
ncbi:MAG TPA: hypothetical protein VHW66_18440 [Stellaceae bacterium]|jgi:DNA repair ATPase RecN|nr:hypothetical protein [Stellaceae bacterium]